MKGKSLYQLILVLVILVIAVKYVPPVNNWARGNLPESILALIGEKPKDVFERSLDRIEEGIKKGTDAVDNIVRRVKK